MAFDVTQHAGEGLDTLETSQSMPILRIIQDGSPIVKKSDPKHAEKKIAGAEAGMLVFAGSEAFASVEVIVLHGQITYTEWENGVPKAHHPVSVVNHPQYQGRGHDAAKKNLEKLGNNVLEKTNNMFVKFRDSEDADWRLGIIPFTSTGLKDAANWGKRLAALKYENGMKAPIFASVWKISTKTESNDFGSWYGWNIEHVKLLDLEADEALLVESSQARSAAVSDAGQMIEAPKQATLEDNDDLAF